MEHSLKTWPKYYNAVESKRKPFEYRVNDRFYSVGDVLVLKEWDPETESYTGKSERRIVTYLMTSGFNLPVGMCIMGIAEETK